MRLLDESKEVMEQVDSYYMAWNYSHRARMASRAGHFEDAIDLYTKSAEKARQTGFLRGLQVSLSGLGDANLEVGDLTAAELAFVEGLSAAERTSMVPEMLGTLVKVARVYAAGGRKSEAVELLATVVADPASEHQLFTDAVPISSMATDELTRLQQEIDDEAFAEAQKTGSARSYGTVAKQLIDSIK
jgi:tetratricopeptide (TPR) repeat protein